MKRAKLTLSVQGSNFVPTPGVWPIWPPQLEIMLVGPFGTKLSMRTKFCPRCYVTSQIYDVIMCDVTEAKINKTA